MRILADLFAPLLAVIVFYVLLGSIIWLLLEPNALGRARQVQLPWPQDPVRQRTLTISAALVLLGLVLTIVPRDIVYRMFGVQAIALAGLILLVERVITWRYRHEHRRQVRQELISPDPATAKAALHTMRANGWLTDGTLAYADLRHIDWSGCELEDADLHNSNLHAGKLRQAKLRSANLIAACLQDVDLRAADCTWADLRGADLSGVRAKGLVLSGANLSQANLNGAKLNNADLRGADLSHATLTATNLKGARLTGTRLHAATYDLSTRWPKGVEPELLGARLTAPVADA